MPDWRVYSDYILRFFFLLLAVISAIAAVLIIASGIGTVLLIVISFFSLLIASKYDNLEINLGDYSLDLGDRLSAGFDGLIEHANKSSNNAAGALGRVKRNSDSGDPFYELSILIDEGFESINQTPIDRLLSNFKISVATRKYVDEFDETKMKVVRFEDNVLHVKSSGKEEFLKSGVKFRIYQETQHVSNNTLEDVTDILGIATVVLSSKGTTKMKVERWLTSLEDENIRELRNNELLGKKLYVDVLMPEAVEDTPIEELEEAYQQLKPIRTEL